MSETIKLNNAKPWEDVDFLIKLYTKKRWSLNRISRHLGCSRYSVRKGLKASGIVNFDSKTKQSKHLEKKVAMLKEKGFGYRKIAKLLNLWGVQTRSGKGKWYAKAVKDVLRSNI